MIKQSCKRVDLADLLNLSERRISELSAGNVIPKPTKTGYNLRACIRGYIAFLREKPASLATEQARFTKAKADLAEVKLKAYCNELVEVAAVRQEAFRTARHVRDGLLNIPDRLAGILAAEDRQEAVREMLEREIVQALEALTGQLQGKSTQKSEPPAGSSNGKRPARKRSR